MGIGVFVGVQLLNRLFEPVIPVLVALIVALILIWLLPRLFCNASDGEVEQAVEVAPQVVDVETPEPSIAVSEPKKTVVKKKPTIKAKPVVKADAKPVAKVASKPAVKPVAKKSAKAKAPAKPKLFSKAPKQIDDLKLISGVGPKMENTLHDVGVYQFQQVAAWTKTDIAFVDDKLTFKGRIVRDGWVKQAKKLMKT